MIKKEACEAAGRNYERPEQVSTLGGQRGGGAHALHPSTEEKVELLQRRLRTAQEK